MDARKKWSMRAKTADGILRYAPYEITGVADSTSKEKQAGEVLPNYLAECKNFFVPIFQNIGQAKTKTNSDVLILGAAPEGGELPREWEEDIEWAIRNHMHIVSGLHNALSQNKKFAQLARRCKVTIWDARRVFDTRGIPVGSSRACAIEKPIVLTVGMDAAIGKMTVAYEMDKAAKKLGFKSCLVPTGQTAIMISGWGVCIDALPADFMAGAVEQMVLDKAKNHDILFVEGQGSLFHPAYANTTIALIHGAVPTHMVLVVRSQRKHSIGSRLIKLPSVKRAILQYESSVLPFYRNAKVIAVAVNSEGLSANEREEYKKEIQKACGLPVFDALYDQDTMLKILKRFIERRG